MWVVIALLVLIVILFGVSSTAQSYATAQQAKAQIETAQVAQINAWGNLITILTLALVIVVVLLILFAALYWFFVRPRIRSARTVPREIQPHPSSPALESSTLNTLVQLEVLRTLRAMNGGGSQPVLRDASREEDDIPLWLR